MNHGLCKQNNVKPSNWDDIYRQHLDNWLVKREVNYNMDPMIEIETIKFKRSEHIWSPKDTLAGWYHTTTWKGEIPGCPCPSLQGH
jgi:uncharacterized protein (DUF488 family)